MLLAKREVKIAGYWPGFLRACGARRGEGGYRRVTVNYYFVAIRKVSSSHILETRPHTSKPFAQDFSVTNPPKLSSHGHI